MAQVYAVVKTDTALILAFTTVYANTPATNPALTTSPISPSTSTPANHLANPANLASPANPESPASPASLATPAILKGTPL